MKMNNLKTVSMTLLIGVGILSSSFSYATSGVWGLVNLKANKVGQALANYQLDTNLSAVEIIMQTNSCVRSDYSQNGRMTVTSPARELADFSSSGRAFFASYGSDDQLPMHGAPVEKNWAVTNQQEGYKRFSHLVALEIPARMSFDAEGNIIRIEAFSTEYRCR